MKCRFALPANMSDMITVRATKWNQCQGWGCKVAPKNAAAPLVAWSVFFYWSCSRFLTIFAKYICHRLLWYTHLKFFLIIYIISNYNYLRRWSHDHRLLNHDWLLLIHWLLILDLITLHHLLLILNWLWNLYLIFNNRHFSLLIIYYDIF